MGDLPLSDAFRLAAERGVSCRLFVGVVERPRSVRVSITTSDPDPLVALSVDADAERWMHERQQSAPDRWDYLAERSELAERCVLRLERGEALADVPVLPAARTILTAHGWTEDTTLLAEARVDAAALHRALDQIAVSVVVSGGQPRGERFAACRFAPWVGPRYESGAVDGLRLLVLGESLYGRHESVERDRSLTHRVVEDHLRGRPRHRFVSTVAAVVAGVRPGDTNGEGAFWNAVAFHNYVQEYAGERARQRPREEAWAQGAPALREVLAELQPDLILVCGRALWEHLKQVDGLTSDPIQEDYDKRIRSRLFDAGGTKVVGGMINHPVSFGFRPAEWRPRVQRYVERALAQRQA